MSTIRVTLALAVVWCAACRHTMSVPPDELVPGLSGAPHVYTLTNLHPDEERVTLYSGNFQQPGLIPICSEVVLTWAQPDFLMFKVVKTGVEYGYYEHKVADEPLLENAAHYFGPACPQAELDALTPLEKDGVRMGVVMKGMRKPAVILAVGYPPKRDTRTTELAVWRYWVSRMRYFTVQFDEKGVVEKIVY